MGPRAQGRHGRRGGAALQPDQSARVDDRPPGMAGATLLARAGAGDDGGPRGTAVRLWQAALGAAARRGVGMVARRHHRRRSVSRQPHRCEAHAALEARVLEGDAGHEAPPHDLSLLVPPRRVAGHPADAGAHEVAGLRRRLREVSVPAGNSWPRLLKNLPRSHGHDQTGPQHDQNADVVDDIGRGAGPDADGDREDPDQRPEERESLCCQTDLAGRPGADPCRRQTDDKHERDHALGGACLLMRVAVDQQAEWTRAATVNAASSMNMKSRRDRVMVWARPSRDAPEDALVVQHDVVLVDRKLGAESAAVEVLVEITAVGEPRISLPYGPYGQLRCGDPRHDELPPLADGHGPTANRERVREGGRPDVDVDAAVEIRPGLAGDVAPVALA